MMENVWPKKFTNSILILTIRMKNEKCDSKVNGELQSAGIQLS